MISIQWLSEKVGILRLHDPGFSAIGEPYFWALVLQEEDHDLDILVARGAVTLPPIRFLILIRKYLASLGYKKLRWERIEDGKVKEVCLTLA